MARVPLSGPTNPYHYAVHCLGGRWKMTILHGMSIYGTIHFNQTLKALPVSEKVLSHQLKELVQDGLVRRVVNSSSFPPAIDYELTDAGKDLIPVLDALYVWSIRQMDAREVPIDINTFVAHQDQKFVDQLGDIMAANGFDVNAEHPPIRWDRE